MPDIFIPNDTSDVTRYYSLVSNAGLFQKFAFNYCDNNRASLKKCKNISDVIDNLPSDEDLLTQFVDFAQKQKITPNSKEINKSRNLILYLIKGLIARDTIGMQGYYEIFNKYDNTVQQAISHIKKGNSTPPIKVNYK